MQVVVIMQAELNALLFRIVGGKPSCSLGGPQIFHDNGHELLILLPPSPM